MPLAVDSVVIVGGSPVTAGGGFDVLVTLNGVVSQDTVVLIATTNGEALGNVVNGTITTGTNSVNINYTYLTVVRTGAVIRASQVSGDVFASGDSASFAVIANTVSRADTTALGSPQALVAFSVRVDSTDGFDNLTPVTQDTVVNLTLGSGTGTLWGNLSGTILFGTQTVTISGIIYGRGENSITVIATSSSGDSIGPMGVNNAFNVSPAAPDRINNTVPTPIVIYGRAPNGQLQAVSSGFVTVETINNRVPRAIMIYGRAPNGQLQAVTTDGNGMLN